MRRVVIAPDSFKECLDAPAVAAAIGVGVQRAWPAATIVPLPLSDGGEGFASTLLEAMHGELRHACVTGPLGEPIEAAWGLVNGGRTAIIETAQAAGLERVPLDLRNPTRTTTRGVGELLRAAEAQGAREALVGLGGSATNDAGLGMAQALGWRLLDQEGKAIPEPAIGADVGRVHRLEPPSHPLALRVRVACDVTSPLVGPDGASRCFARQKGATPAQVEELERGMRQLAAVLAGLAGTDIAERPGSGAAGGLGAGLAVFAGATLQPGASLVLDLLDFDRQMEGASLVITGEGAVNAQTLRGKLPWAVYQRARDRGVPVLLLCGDCRDAPAALLAAPGLSVRAIAPRGTSTAESMARARELLAASAAGHLARL